MNEGSFQSDHQAVTVHRRHEFEFMDASFADNNFAQPRPIAEKEDAKTVSFIEKCQTTPVILYQKVPQVPPQVNKPLTLNEISEDKLASEAINRGTDCEQPDVDGFPKSLTPPNGQIDNRHVQNFYFVDFNQPLKKRTVGGRLEENTQPEPGHIFGSDDEESNGLPQQSQTGSQSFFFESTESSLFMTIEDASHQTSLTLTRVGSSILDNLLGDNMPEVALKLRDARAVTLLIEDRHMKNLISKSFGIVFELSQKV